MKEVKKALYNPDSLLYEMGYSISKENDYVMKMKNWDSKILCESALHCVFASVELKVQKHKEYYFLLSNSKIDDQFF